MLLVKLSVVKLGKSMKWQTEMLRGHRIQLAMKMIAVISVTQVK
jgi:hypothetical protein